MAMKLEKDTITKKRVLILAPELAVTAAQAQTDVGITKAMPLITVETLNDPV